MVSKFIVELWLDGYTDESEREKAEEEFIYEQLNFSASSVKITRVPETPDLPERTAREGSEG